MNKLKLGYLTFALATAMFTTELYSMDKLTNINKQNDNNKEVLTDTNKQNNNDGEILTNINKQDDNGDNFSTDEINNNNNGTKMLLDIIKSLKNFTKEELELLNSKNLTKEEMESLKSKILTKRKVESSGNKNLTEKEMELLSSTHLTKEKVELLNSKQLIKEENRKKLTEQEIIDNKNKFINNMYDLLIRVDNCFYSAIIDEKVTFDTIAKKILNEKYGIEYTDDLGKTRNYNDMERELLEDLKKTDKDYEKINKEEQQDQILIWKSKQLNAVFNKSLILKYIHESSLPNCFKSDIDYINEKLSSISNCLKIDNNIKKELDNESINIDKLLEKVKSEMEYLQNAYKMCEEPNINNNLIRFINQVAYCTNIISPIVKTIYARIKECYSNNPVLKVSTLFT